MVLGKLDQYMQKNNETKLWTTIPYTRINSKWIKYLKVHHKTIKILEEKIGSKISDISYSDIFAGISPRTR